MPDTQTNYKGKSITIAGTRADLEIKIDNQSLPVHFDSGGDKDLYSSRDLPFRSFEDPVELAKAFIDQEETLRGE